jgi:hypothetical protein
MCVPAIFEAENAYRLFLNTISAASPKEAVAIFDQAHAHLRSSISWVPNRPTKIDLWNTEQDREILVNMLDRVGLRSRPGQPILIYPNVYQRQKE